MQETKDTTTTTTPKTEVRNSLPKGTERFCAIIKAHLDRRAEEDELFRTRMDKVNRPIEDIVAYILGEVQKSGAAGWADDEVFSLAIHAAEEENLEIHRVGNMRVVVNHQVELTEEEKEEQRQLALKQFREEELAKIKARNTSKPSAPKSVKPISTPSLFDF